MELDRSATSLLVLDLQHDIVSSDGALGSHGLGAEVERSGVLERCAKVLQAARQASLPVVHVGVEVRDGSTVNTSAALLSTVVATGALRAGSEGAGFEPRARPRSGELVVLKPSVSAFAGTSLDLHLRSAGINHVVLCGVATNFVVEGTARDAVDRGYRVTVLGDACCSFTPAWHDTALEVLAMLAGVTGVDEFVSALG